MLALPSIIALTFVAFFASAGILESFSRGMHAASTYKFMRPGPVLVTEQPKPALVVPAADQLIATPINHYNGNDGDVNISSTMMPTISGVLQRVDLCHFQNIVVPLTPADGQQPQQKELIFKSIDFPFKRTDPLVCSWNVKVSDNCRRGIVTMKINERSRLASEKGCRKGYYRVSPFMNDAKICGRVNNVPAFQWYIEDRQPENVTITLKHNGLNDGFSEGLGFTLAGECLPEESDLTISKAIKSYKNWLDQLSRKSSTGELTVFLPADVPLEPIISLWESRPNVTKGSVVFANVTLADDSTTIQLSNSSQSTDPTEDSSDDDDIDLPPIAIYPFSPSSQNESNAGIQPLLPQMDGNTDKAEPVHLTIISDSVVTDSPLPITTTTTNTTTFQSIETTAQPLLISPQEPPVPEIILPVPEIILPVSDHNSPLSFPMIRRRPLPTTKKPITRAPISRRPPTTSVFPASRKRPPVPLSSDNPDIPWLILKSPAGDPSLSDMYYPPTPSSTTTTTTTARPLITHHQEMVRPVQRRPLVRLPSTTVGPASISSSSPWIILKSPQTNKNQKKKKRPAPIRPKDPVVDHQGIPWLILHSPVDPHPSSSSSDESSESESSEMNYYPDIPSNQLYKRKDSFPGYFVPTL